MGIRKLKKFIEENIKESILPSTFSPDSKLLIGYLSRSTMSLKFFFIIIGYNYDFDKDCCNSLFDIYPFIFPFLSTTSQFAFVQTT